MTSFERLFAGALVATAMALPAYAQTQSTETPIFRPEFTQQEIIRPGSSAAPSETPGAPTNAELAVDAVTEPEADDGEATIEDSAILPSAGDQEASRAPSMDLDCEKNPKECLQPLTQESTGPTLSTQPVK